MRSPNALAVTRPGTVGGVVSRMVAQAGSEAADRLPAASSAVTFQQYSFPGVRRSSRAEVPPTEATRASARNTSYPVTPTSSVDGLQESSAALPGRAVAVTPSGGVGGTVSSVRVHTAAQGAEVCPA